MGDWWDDERTTAEADQARWQQAGRLVSTAAAAAAAASTALQPVVLPGGTSTASAAAAVAGAFMFQRNLRLIIAENMLYIRLWLCSAAACATPALLVAAVAGRAADAARRDARLGTLRSFAPYLHARSPLVAHDALPASQEGQGAEGGIYTNGTPRRPSTFIHSSPIAFHRRSSSRCRCRNGW